MKISLFVVLLALAAPLYCQQPDPHSVPSVDGGIGNCSADFTVTDDSNPPKPVYGAKVRVHIAYGFMYARKMDLEVGTNVDGKARISGMPERVKKGLFFEATEGDRTANAFDDPDKTCTAQFTLVLRKKP